MKFDELGEVGAEGCKTESNPRLDGCTVIFPVVPIYQANPLNELL